MEERILQFADSLRKAGVRVSPGEVIECLQALKVFGVSDREIFYRVLKAALIKSEMDRAVFELAFRLYFQEEAEKPLRLTVAGSCLGGNSVDGSGAGKAGMGNASRQLYGAVRNRQADDLINMIQKQLNQLQAGEENVDQLVHRVKIKMEWFMVENAFEREGLGSRENMEILKDLEDYLRHSIEKLVVDEKGQDVVEELLSDENLYQKDFAILNEFQIKEMEKRVARLANRLASCYSYRLKPAKSGRIDMRRMLQKAACLGRTPEQLFFQDKVLNKPRVVVMCDISGSVAVYSTFLLQLVYAMARRFGDMRTFLFVDEIAEVTEELKNSNIREAVDRFVKEARCSRLGISNFGQVFETFHRNYGKILTPKTSLMILGDAKNNWYPPRQEELETLSRMVKEIIWLNPEPLAKWNRDDSVIGLYGKYCSHVEECRNLKQLERAVRKIV